MLKLELAELREWESREGAPLHLFVDARGHPPHLGAVLFHESGILWTHLEPEKEIMECFKSRRDNQIMGLELLAISLGLATFEKQLEGRKVVIHSDNTGSEAWFCYPRLP